MPKFPFLVQRGSATVRIRPYDNHGSEHFLITWNALGRRRRESRASLEAAKLRAGEIATSISNGQIGALELTGADRDSYAHAVRLLIPLKMPLHAAIQEFVEARNIAKDVSLLETAREYAQRHSERIRTGTVAEVVDLCLARKRADNLSDRYLVQLRSDLKRFAAAFQMPVGGVATDQLETWLLSLGVSPRTRDNLRTSLTTFFSFCRANGYLPQHLPTAADAIQKIKVPETDVVVFSPQQLQALLNAAPPSMIPYIALGAFAGLRPHEITRLNWDAIRFAPIKERHIEVKASKAKTGSRRLAPLPQNLIRWLEPCVADGPIVQHPETWRDVTALARSLGITWRQDVLRHSAISYWVALTGDVARVALQSGNSSQVIFKHYYQLVTKSAAAAWFAIAPQKKGLARNAGIAKRPRQ